MAAPVLSLGDIIQVSIASTYAEQRVLLVTTWRVNDLAAPGEYLVDMQSIANHFGSTAAGKPLVSYLAVLPTNLTVNFARAQRIYSPRSAFVDQTVDEPGTWAAVASTGNLAAAVTRKTSNAGRSQQSVSHIGPLPDSTYVAGSLTAPYFAALETFALEWLEEQVIPGGSGIELMPVVFHANEAVPNADDLVTSFINPRSRTMRRRTVGVGE